MKFQTGQIVMTRSINDTIAESSQFSRFVLNSIRRYIVCDWGEMCSEDARMNDSAVKNNDDRIVARYNNKQGDIYIITEWDRSVTTILFIDEY